MNTCQKTEIQQNRNRIRVLLVEDSDSDAFLFENLLQEIDDIEFCVQRAARLEDAVDFLNETSYDVVLLDLSLPDSSGLSTLCSILEVTRTSIIVLTGSPDLTLRSTAIRKGAQDYLPKNGLDSQILRRTIEYSIERQQLLLKLNQNLVDLKASEERTRRMFDQNFDGIAVIDQTGNFLYLNAAAEAIFGSTKELLLGKPFGQDMSDTIIEIPKADGYGTSKVELRKRAIEWENTNAWLVVLRDISKQIDLEDRLRQSQKLEAVGRLAGGVAHDFNNQLTAIMGFTELAMRTKDPVKATKHLEHVRKATEKSAALTCQLLSFGRKQVLKPEAVCLNSLLSEIEKMLHRVIREDIELRVLADPDLGFALVDNTQIDQVIMNLVINASDAMPDGGLIVIETANVHIDKVEHHREVEMAEGEYIQLIVSDTGIGMDSSILGRIFEPFFTTKEIGKGTGLGLATVYGIINQSNGYITVDSEPGVGTTFKVYLPRCGAIRSDTLPLPAFDKVRAMPRTILVVEDEPEVLAMIRTGLELEKVDVICASNGLSALQKIRKLGKPVDLLLTDLIMPKMSGKDLAAQIQREFADVQVIFMSGYTRETIVKNGILNEGINLIQKPITPSSLVRYIKQVFRATESNSQISDQQRI